jgi:hypothetical protein
MKNRKDRQGDINNANTFAVLLESTETSKISNRFRFNTRHGRALPTWSKKDATTGLDRHDVVQKDPLVKMFQMLGLFCYPRPAENESSDRVLGIMSRASMASHPVAALGHGSRLGRAFVGEELALTNCLT